MISSFDIFKFFVYLLVNSSSGAVEKDSISARQIVSSGSAVLSLSRSIMNFVGYKICSTCFVVLFTDINTANRQNINISNIAVRKFFIIPDFCSW